MLPPQAVTLITVSCVFSLLACIAVALRLWARRYQKKGIGWSDYFICFTLLNAVLNAIACIIGGVACGIGLPLAQLPDYMEVRFLKVLFAIQFFIIFSVWGVKVSIVLFYRSIFETVRFRRVVDGTLVVLGAWIVAMFFTTLFQDNPIERNWGTSGTTINWRDFYIVTIASDLALDIFILCMPLPVIRRLHVSKREKWLLVGIFWLGAFIVVSSIVRLVYEVQVLQQFDSEDDDFSFTTVNTVIWGAVEPCTSVVAACLPIFVPVLWKRGVKRGGRSRTGYYNYSSRQSGSTFKRSEYPLRDRDPNHGRYDSEDLGRTHRSEIGAGAHGDDGVVLVPEPERILVTQEVRVDEM